MSFRELMPGVLLDPAGKLFFKHGYGHLRGLGAMVVIVVQVVVVTVALAVAVAVVRWWWRRWRPR